jgi:hypothetical protein
MQPQNKSNNEWKPQSFLSRHWDAAVYGFAATACFVAPEFGIDPRVKSIVMCSGVVVLAAEHFICQKARHTIAKSAFIAAMMGSVAYDIYQSPPVQQQIPDNAPIEIAPPIRG